MRHVSDEEYRSAKKIMFEYFMYNKTLEKAYNELAERLAIYSGRFVFNFQGRTTIFAVYDGEKVRIGYATRSYCDVDNKKLGKLIALRRAFNEPVNDLIELVEPVSCKEWV